MDLSSFACVISSPLALAFIRHNLVVLAVVVVSGGSKVGLVFVVVVIVIDLGSLCVLIPSRF